jgi:LysR family nitrogen assimilation transcriptional regulator
MDIPHSAISLRQLRYLVEVADAGSFVAAAELTHVAQPALSRQIALLEAQVGARLLERSRKGVALTPAGVHLCGLARSMLVQLGSVQKELRSDKKRPAGVVNVALPPSVASMLVPRVVRELEARYPGVELRIADGLSLENGRSLEAALIDFGIVPTAAELAGVEYEPLVEESLFLVEPRRKSLRVPATVALDQVARLKLILPPRTFHTRRVIDEAARTSRVALNIGYEQSSVMTIVSLVRDGLGATIANSPAVDQYWAPGAVTARRIVKPEIKRTVSLARSSKRPLSPAAEAVYEVVRHLAIEAVNDGRWQGTRLS